MNFWWIPRISISVVFVFLKVNQLTAFSFRSFHFWIYENDCGFFCAWRKTALAYLCPTPCQQSHPHASSCLQHSASRCLLQCCAKWTTWCKSFLAFLDTIKGILPLSSFFFLLLFPLHLECTVIRSKHGYYLLLCCTDQRGTRHGKFTVHEMKNLRGFIRILNFMNSDGSGACITTTTKKSIKAKKKKKVAPWSFSLRRVTPVMNYSVVSPFGMCKSVFHF